METKIDVGVVIGRFQVHELHDGHVAVIKRAEEESRNLLVFIGVAPALGTKHSPLDYSTRAKMVQEKFPNAIVLPLLDRPTNAEWSKHLDLMIRATFPIGSVRLYGGRDAFIPYYSGSYPTVEIDTVTDTSATAIREDVGKIVQNDSSFRAGIIYSAYNQYPRVHMTVDVAVVRDNKVLMGRRSLGDLLRFPGGFVSPTDESLEDAAARELHEEFDLEGLGGVDSFKFIGSFKVNDWRYQHDQKIITALFTVPFGWGQPKIKDEFEELAWVHISKINLKKVTDNHKPLFEALLKHHNTKNNIDEKNLEETVYDD